MKYKKGSVFKPALLYYNENFLTLTKPVEVQRRFRLH